MKLSTQRTGGTTGAAGCSGAIQCGAAGAIEKRVFAVRFRVPAGMVAVAIRSSGILRCVTRQLNQLCDPWG